MSVTVDVPSKWEPFYESLDSYYRRDLEKAVVNAGGDWDQGVDRWLDHSPANMELAEKFASPPTPPGGRTPSEPTTLDVEAKRITGEDRSKGGSPGSLDAQREEGEHEGERSGPSQARTRTDARVGSSNLQGDEVGDDSDREDARQDSSNLYVEAVAKVVGLRPGETVTNEDVTFALSTIGELVGEPTEGRKGETVWRVKVCISNSTHNQGSMRVVRDAEDMFTAGCSECSNAREPKWAKVTRKMEAALGFSTDFTEGGSSEEQESQTDILMGIVMENYDLGISVEGVAFVVPKDGPKLVSLIKGSKSALTTKISAAHFKQKGKVPSSAALADVMKTIEGLAGDLDPTPLFLRVAETNDASYIDIGDATGDAIMVTGDGWEVVSEPPVMFRRTQATAAFPRPVRGGSLDLLWGHLNIDPDDRGLYVAVVVGALLYPEIPHPIVAFEGEQGTGKSSATRTTVGLIDPSTVPLRKRPKDQERWKVAALASWAVALDNSGEPPEWLMDSLCRASTGDGDVDRSLYTNLDVTVSAFRRQVIINGIDLGALRGDVVERLVRFALVAIHPKSRMTEREFADAWRRDYPAILGAVLDIAARVRGLLPTISLDETPRMADLAYVVAAVDKVMGTNALEVFASKQETTSEDISMADPFIASVRRMVVRLGGSWEGTSAELLKAVEDNLNHNPRDRRWPRDARAVTSKLRNFAPTMRKTGWSVSDDGGSNHGNVTKWTVVAPRKTDS